MPKTKDSYTPQERQEYNRHYYPNNKERIQEQRRSPLAVQRRKLYIIRQRYQKQIAELLEKMVQETALVHSSTIDEVRDEPV